MTGGRIAWLDLARALTILLVVVYHVAVGAGAVLMPDEESGAGQWWSTANLMLRPVRMPLFFLIAGILAAGAVSRPWNRSLRPRVLDLWWPYLLWSGIFLVTAWIRYAPQDPAGYMLDQVVRTFTAAGPYWFIGVLPLFFLIARLGRRHPWAMLLLGAVLYAATWPIGHALSSIEAVPPPVVSGLGRVTSNAVWYLAGLALRTQILSFAQRAPLVLGIAGMCAYGLCASFLQWGEPAVLLERLALAAATISGMGAAVALTPRLARILALDRMGRYLSRRTLVIYLVHPLVINLVVVLHRDTALGDLLAGTWASAVLLVPVVTATAVLAALGVDRIVSRWGPSWLLSAPAGAPAAPDGSSVR